MGCAVGCLALAFPRLALVLVWFFGPTGYLREPFPHVVWPIAGFLLLPTTTLAFSFSMMSVGVRGEMTPFGWLLTLIALLIDLGSHGKSGQVAARRRRRRDDDAADG